MDTERRIRDVATRLFYSRGYHGTSMRDIAAALGMKAGSLYNHYAGKEELLFRIVLDTTRDFVEGARAAVSGTEDPEARLRALLEWHVSFHARRRLEAKVADIELRSLDESRRRQVVALRDGYEGLLRGILAEGQAACGWRLPDLSILSIGIETMCTEVATWYREGGRLQPDEIARIFADFILAALRPASRSGAATSRASRRDSRTPRRRGNEGE